MMQIAEALRFASCAELGAALDSGQVTSMMLTQAYLNAIARLNPALNCYLRQKRAISAVSAIKRGVWSMGFRSR
jgi:Asp-tRNA(Asn)/Glu-tRNA(Gln) amidotransferase A subunit family amidase